MGRCRSAAGARLAPWSVASLWVLPDALAASDFGVLPAALALNANGLLCALNLPLVLSMAHTRAYANRTAAVVHSVLGSVPTVIAWIVTAATARAIADPSSFFVFNACALPIAWLPLLFHRFQRRRDTPPAERLREPPKPQP